MIDTNRIKKELPGVAKDTLVMVIAIIISAVVYNAVKSEGKSTRWLGWIGAIGGLIGAALTNNPLFKILYIGFGAAGAINATGILGSNPLSGLGCDECGGTCGGNGINGLGAVFDAQTLINNGTVRTGVTRAMMLSLPNATPALVDRLANQTPLKAFYFTHNTGPYDAQQMSAWDMIYNYYPFLFTKILSNNGNIISQVAKIEITPPDFYPGGLNALPLHCAKYKLTLMDNSVVKGVYDISLYRQGLSPCAFGKACLPSLQANFTTYNAKNQKIFQSAIGEEVIIKADDVQDGTITYIWEFSDGEIIQTRDQQITKIWRSGGYQGTHHIRLIILQTKNAGTTAETLCVSNLQQGFIISGSSTPVVVPPPSTKPAVITSCEFAGYTVSNPKPVVGELVTFTAKNPENLPAGNFTWDIAGETFTGLVVQKVFTQDGQNNVDLYKLCTNGTTSHLNGFIIVSKPTVVVVPPPTVTPPPPTVVVVSPPVVIPPPLPPPVTVYPKVTPPDRPPLTVYGDGGAYMIDCTEEPVFVSKYTTDPPVVVVTPPPTPSTPQVVNVTDGYVKVPFDFPKQGTITTTEKRKICTYL